MTTIDAGQAAAAATERALRDRVFEEREASTRLSAVEQRRLVELLCVGIERRLKKHGLVDLSPDLSVDADVPEEGKR